MSGRLIFLYGSSTRRGSFHVNEDRVMVHKKEYKITSHGEAPTTNTLESFEIPSSKSSHSCLPYRLLWKTFNFSFLSSSPSYVLSTLLKTPQDPKAHYEKHNETLQLQKIDLMSPLQTSTPPMIKHSFSSFNLFTPYCDSTLLEHISYPHYSTDTALFSPFPKSKSFSSFTETHQRNHHLMQCLDSLLDNPSSPWTFPTRFPPPFIIPFFALVCDGHDGPEAAEFVSRHLYFYFLQALKIETMLSHDPLKSTLRSYKKAFQHIENSFHQIATHSEHDSHRPHSKLRSTSGTCVVLDCGAVFLTLHTSFKDSKKVNKATMKQHHFNKSFFKRYKKKKKKIQIVESVVKPLSPSMFTSESNNHLLSPMSRCEHLNQESCASPHQDGMSYPVYVKTCSVRSKITTHKDGDESCTIYGDHKINQKTSQPEKQRGGVNQPHFDALSSPARDGLSSSYIAHGPSLKEQDYFNNSTDIFRVQRLSQSHRLCRTSELERIVQLGGVIVNNRIKGLEPTRCIGDFDVKNNPPYGLITCEPDVTYVRITQPGIVVIASDGVWDSLSIEQIIGFICKEKKRWNRLKPWLLKSSVKKFDHTYLTRQAPGGITLENDLSALAHLVTRRALHFNSDDSTCLLVYVTLNQ